MAPKLGKFKGFGMLWVAEIPGFPRAFDQKASEFPLKSLVRNRNSPDLFTVTFYERHLWAGLLGWPD
jgi:hypothetical protein